MKKTCMLIVLVFTMSMCGCRQTELEHNGQWYCDDLKLHISFANTYSETDKVWFYDNELNEYISCGIRHYGKNIEVMCAEINHHTYEQYYMFFEGKICSVTKEYFVVKEVKTGNEYTFIKT